MWILIPSNFLLHSALVVGNGKMPSFEYFYFSPLHPRFLLMQNFMAMHSREPLGSGHLVLISAPKIGHQMLVYL